MYSKAEIKALNGKFWELFRQRCKAHPKLRDKKKNFILHRTKIRGIAFRFEITRTDAKVMLELHHRNEDTRLKAFELLDNYKSIIENGFENGLIWEFYHQREDSGQEVCRIYTLMKGANIHEQTKWPEIYNFFIDNMLQLEDNFNEISDIIREALQG